MKKILRIGLLLLGIGIISLALLNCDLLAGSMLEGTWLREDGNYRWTFNSDRTFTEENWNGSAWEIVSDGDYIYNTINQDLELDDQMNGNAVVYDIIMNTAADRMALGVDALTGGNTSTLLGTWTGGFTVDSTPFEDTWIFNSNNTFSYTNLSGNTATGDVIINTAATEFTVSGSNNTGVLANGTYQYMVIGDGITISEAGDPAVDRYYDKQ